MLIGRVVGGVTPDPIVVRLLAALELRPDIRAQVKEALLADDTPDVTPVDPPARVLSKEEIRRMAEEWVDTNFSQTPARVSHFNRAALDWNIAVGVVQVLYNRFGDLHLFDPAKSREVVVDTDIGLAWECPLSRWGHDVSCKHLFHTASWGAARALTFVFGALP